MSVPLVYHSELPGPLPTDGSLGGKAANLLRLAQLDVTVPPFYTITTRAFHEALHEGALGQRIEQRLGSVTPDDDQALRQAADEIRTWVTAGGLPESLKVAMRAVHERIGADQYVAVRSSAADEDTAGQSFAGMHDSFLFVRGIDAVGDAVRKVWASAYNERALAYRRSRGLAWQGIAVAVVVQQMIDADRSGVMFTCDPATASPHKIALSALYGAGEGLVSAGLDADTYLVDKETLEITSEIAEKTEQMLPDDVAGRGLKRGAVAADDQKRSSLTDTEIRALAGIGLAIEEHFRRPQDIEFCFAGGQLYVLQSRPVTNIEQYGPAAGNHTIWDNSNIIESYSGVTSPMTFSFIRRAYSIVYDCFAEVMGISPQVVRDNRKTFDNMLGLIRGRVYYNLKNWYRLIRLFPGYHYNARFMESMMGVKESFDLDDPEPPTGFWQRWFVELPALLRLLARSTWNFWRIRARVDQFESNFRRHYGSWSALDLDSMAPHELMSLYYDMEDALLWNWKAPIINDFYVMIYYGVLKKLCGSWCQDESGSLQNDLICGEGGIESAEPTKMLLRLAQIAQDDKPLREMILNDPLEELPEPVAAAQQFSEFNQLMQRYLDLYGFRCMNELKLEEYSLRDRPHVVYQVIRNYLKLDDPAALDVDAMGQREQRIRREAEQRAFGSLSWPRSSIFRFALKRARLGVKNRENMRFARTRIYGLLREVIRALGPQLAAESILDDREDIFYLTLDELWDFIKGTAVTTNLRDLAALRRAEFDGYRDEQTPAPDERFDTYGMVYHYNTFEGRAEQIQVPTDGSLRGIGCCPGEITGTVKVLRTPTDDMNLSGEILVAERTDPGWVPLYPAVSGLLIERGSILSHSAVVAREMGIPTIVGITGLLKTVSTGDRITMDGRAGTVEVHKQPSETETSA